MNEDKDIQEALNSLATDQEPSDELLRKLRLAAKITKPARTPWWQSKLSMGVAFASVAVVAVLTMMPAQASAKSFALIEEAAQHVNAFQFSIRSNDNKEKDGLTIAGEDGRVYMRTNEGSFMQFEAGAMSIYDPAEKKIMRIKFGKMVPVEEIAKSVQSGLAEGFKEMDLKKMLKDYADKYGRERIVITPVRWENGRNVYHVTLSSKSEPDRVFITADAKSDLPVRIEVEGRDDRGNWNDSVVMEMRFGSEVDSSLLRANFPANAKVEEIDLDNVIGDAMKGVEGIGKAFENFGKEFDKPKKP